MGSNRTKAQAEKKEKKWVLQYHFSTAELGLPLE
jgi:hypothetical protein